MLLSPPYQFTLKERLVILLYGAESAFTEVSVFAKATPDRTAEGIEHYFAIQSKLKIRSFTSKLNSICDICHPVRDG
jgi:hypothetical protein